MADTADRARGLGEQAGEATRGFLPTVGRFIEGLWDGLVGNTPDQPGDVYAFAYEIGAFIPDMAVALWDFLVGFVQGFL